MTRSPELHDRFAEWLAARPSGAPEDPPRDLALHAAGCERCLRSATALDTLDAIDVGAAAAPPLRAAPVRQRRRGWIPPARQAAAGAALLLVAGSVAIGASWLADGRTAASAEPRATQGEGVLAGAPSSTEGTRSTATPSPSPSERPSPSAEPSEGTPEPAFATPQPTFQPLPPPAPTAAPTIAPPVTPAPTPTPLPSPTTPAPTPTTDPTTTPTPIPIPACSNLTDDDGDGLTDFPLDPGCTGPDDEDETGP